MTGIENTMLTYLRQTEKKLSDPHWQPHPIIKALVLALHAAEEGKKDGNYMGVSGDAELHGGVPHMMYGVVLGKQADKYQLLNVTDLTTGRTVTTQTIQQIIGAETELEKFAGDTVPIDVAVRIMNQVFPDVTVMKLDKKDRNAAIQYAKEQIRKERLQGVEQSFLDKILAIKDVSEWGNLPSQVRSIIGTMWDSKMPRGPTIVITHANEDIEKWKVREFITFKLSI